GQCRAAVRRHEALRLRPRARPLRRRRVRQQEADPHQLSKSPRAGLPRSSHRRVARASPCAGTSEATSRRDGLTQRVADLERPSTTRENPRGVSFAAIGAIFAGFRVEKVIGSGAMGDVYLAEDTRSGDRVALKVLRAELTEDERFRRRFEREAAIASSLDHPGVVRTIAAGASGRRPYLWRWSTEG